MKHGQIEIQFNWIFVVVVGVIFLLFFFGIITSQTNDSEDRISISLSRNFQTILATTGQKDDTFKEYNVPPTELTFVCNTTEDLYHYNLGRFKAKDTKHDVLFSPPRLSSRTLYTWTAEWNMPFSISTFLYVSNDKQVYVFTPDGVSFESSSSDFLELYESFPTNMTVFLRNTTVDVKPSLNVDMFTYIFFKDQLPANQDDLLLVDEDATIVIIDNTIAGCDLFDCGYIYLIPVEEFSYEKNLVNYLSTTGANYRTTYAGKASFFGAIFSQNVPRYECEMQKAYNRLRNLAALQEYRIQALINDVSSTCATHLGKDPGVPGPLQSVANIKAIAQNGFVASDAPTLHSYANQLQLRNDALAILGNCPPIY